ncbi:unnamed protein product [Lathyrus oleraceus]
MDLEI